MVKMQAGAQGRRQGMGSDSGLLLGLHMETSAVLCCAVLCVAFELQFRSMENGSDLPGYEAGAGAGWRAA